MIVYLKIKNRTNSRSKRQIINNMYKYTQFNRT